MKILITISGLIALTSFSQNLISQDLSGSYQLNPDIYSKEVTINPTSDISDADSSDYDLFFSEIISKLSDPSLIVRLSDDDQCSASELLLQTQAEVDAFNCSAFDGTIIIKGAEITNIDSFSQLTAVEGNLMIYLTSLTDLSGLSNLSNVSERFGIDSNNQLISLTGLSSLNAVNQGFYIHNNSQLSTFEALSGLTSIRDLSIKNNPQLPNLQGLSNISEVKGTITITENHGLTSLEGFPSASTIAGLLIISNNNQLINVDGMESLKAVQYHLFISDNQQLNNLNGITNLEIVRLSLNIYRNPQLTICQQICPLLQNYYATHSPLDYFKANISDNGPGCSEIEILDHCGIDFCSGYKRITSQNEINLLNCHNYYGSIIIYDYNNEIENIDSLYNLITVTGSLELHKTNIENLDGLSQLHSIGETLYINENTELQNISGLNQLDSVGYNIIITNNNQLTSLNGISGIKYIGGGLTINNNSNLNLCCDAFPLLNSNVVSRNISITDNGPDCTQNSILSYCPLDYCHGNLTLNKQEQVDVFSCTSYDGSITITGEDISNLNSLFMLDSIKGSLKIYSTSLQNLNGLENLTYINGNLGIDNNDQLTTLNGLSGLNTVKSSIFINNNNLLDSLDGLSSLTSLPYGGLKIFNNDNLQSLRGLEGLSSISKGLDIEYNDNLESLEGLSLNQVGSLKITNNPMLDDCCVLYPLVSSGDIPGDIQIENNSGNCSASGILVNCIDCKGYLVLDSQEKVDVFGCSVFSGDIRITGQDITNLDGLSVLDSIIGSLNIVNTSLQNLDGLNALSFVGKNLGIHENYSLINIDGLSGLEVVQGSVFINNSEKLANLNGLSNLRSIGRDLKINKNDLLTNLNGLSELISVGQDLIITHNINLETLEGPQLLSSIGNDLIISRNLGLEDLYGIPKISSINGALKIETNKVLRNLSGLSNITKIKDLEIVANVSLLTLDGLSGLTEVETLAIASNVSLQNLTGLSALTSISNSLYINHTYYLQSLEGLPPLDSINNIQFYYNTKLSDINALTGLKKIKGDLSITQNYELTNLIGLSDVQSVEGNIEIYGNKLSNVDDLGLLEYVGGDLTIPDIPETNYCGIYDLLSSNNIGGEITLNGNIEDILSHCALSTCSGTITLDTQEKVDAFNCTSFEGSVRISGENITNVDALSNLENISGYLTIENTSVEHLNLQNLSQIGIELIISRNSMLKDLDGLSALHSTGGFLLIENNAGLEQIDGLSNLKETDYIVIYKNNALSNIDGISGLTEIEDIYIYDNSNLTSIQGLEYIPDRSISIGIENNPLLTECCILNYLLNLRDDDEISIFIRNNGPGCSSENEILAICNEGNSCYGSITLNSQVKIDTFNCTSYLGSITITGEDITNLNGLSGLQAVEGNLIINHTSLSTLDGLDSLKYIGLDLEMMYNLQLINIGRFANITSVGRDLYLEGNDKLETLDGFSNVSNIGRKLMLLYNFQLNDLSGLSNISSLHSLYLWGNNLNSLEALSGLTHIEDVLFIYQSGLTNLDGLEGITSLEQLELYGNFELLNLNGLSNLVETRNIFISYNPKLTDCCALYPVLSSGLTSLLSFNGNPDSCTPEYILANCNDPSARLNNNKDVNDQLGVSGPEYQIYPNPLNKDILSLDLESESDCDMEIRIFNLQGNDVYNNITHIKKGQNTLQLDLSHLTNGAYILYFKNNNKTNHEKIIKSN